MPRDGAGNYTLPPGNPVVPVTLIDVDWANPTMADIALQLNGVLTRDGLLGPLSPFRLVDGVVTLPGLSFAAEATSGLFRPSSGVLGVSVLGVQRAAYNGVGFSVTGTITASGGITAPLFTGRVLAADGTSALPSIAFTSAPGTGLFLAGPDGLGFSSQGAERMQILGDGRVGIGGQPASGRPLHVFSSPGGLGAIALQAVGSLIPTGGAAFVEFRDDGGSRGAAGFIGTPNTFDLLNNLNGPMQFWTNNTTRMSISAAGNVSINPAAAGATLTLGGVAVLDTQAVGARIGRFASLDVTTVAGVSIAQNGLTIGAVFTGMADTGTALSGFSGLIFATNTFERLRIAADGLSTFTRPNEVVAHFQNDTSGAVAAGITFGSPGSSGLSAGIAGRALSGNSGELFLQPVRLGALFNAVTVATNGTVSINIPFDNGVALSVNPPASNLALDLRGQAAGNPQAALTLGVSDQNFRLRVRNGATGTAAGTLQAEISLDYIGVGTGPSVRWLRGAVTTDGSLGLWAGGANRLSVTPLGLFEAVTGFELGYKDVPLLSTGVTTFPVAAAERGRCITMASGSATQVRADSAPAGTQILVAANAGTRSVIAGAGVTVVLAGTGTIGTRSIATNGLATLFWISSTTVWVSGPGVT